MKIMKRTKLTAIVLTSLMITSVIPFNVNAIRTTNVNTSVESSTNTESTETTAPPTVTEPTTASEQVTTEPTTASEQVTTEPTTVTEPTTADVTSKKPTTSAKTKISLNKTSKTLYVKQSFNLKPSIKNGKGKTTFKTSSKKIATVSKKGKITAKKKGTVTITVTNNKVKASCKVTVKNPKLNKKKVTLDKGKSTKLAVTGKVGKATFKSSNKKIASVSKSGNIKALKKGTATITVKANGIKLKCKVTVKVPDLFYKKVKIKYTYDKNVTLNIGQPAKKVKYTYTDNLMSLLTIDKLGYPVFNKGVSKKQWGKFEDKLLKIVNNPTYSVSDSKIIKFDSAKKKVIPVSKGKATLYIKLGNQTLKQKYNITKVSETTFKGKKYKAVYSDKEAYKIAKDIFYNYTLKGNESPYEGVVCFYKDNLFEYVRKKARANCGNEKNLAYFAISPDDISIWQGFHFDSDADNNLGVNVYDICDDAKNLKLAKDLYTEAQRIFKQIDIEKYDSPIEKLFALNHWMKTYCKYDDKYLDIGGNAKYIILNHTGVCSNYANATVYFCTLLNIPCVYITGPGHAWNAINYEGKWYHIDLLWGLMYLGNSEIDQTDSHTSKFENEIGVKIDMQDENLLTKEEIAKYHNEIPWTFD